VPFDIPRRNGALYVLRALVGLVEFSVPSDPERPVHGTSAGKLRECTLGSGIFLAAGVLARARARAEEISKRPQVGSNEQSF